MIDLFISARKDKCAGVGNAAPLQHAMDLITSDCRARASEWSRHGREDLAEAFRRIEGVVGGMT